MGQRVKALADELEAVDLSLIIKFLELDDVFTEGKVGFSEAGDGDRALVYYPNAENELAEMFVVLVGENAIEDAGSKAVYV